MENLKYEVIVETNEIIERPMTDQELATDEIDRANEAAKVAAELAAATEAEAARQALLDKLGITADEAKLLLG